MTEPTEPTPKADVVAIAEKASWEVTSMLPDVRLRFNCDRSFEDVFEQRRTRRVFNPVTLRETRGFVKHLFAARQIGRNAQLGRMRKAFISSGALHPIDVIILSGPDVDEPILYNDAKNKFVTLNALDRVGLTAAIEDADALLPTANGHLILLVGDGRRLSANYLSSASLLWRDAGAALQACAIASHAYDYAFCPLGHTGEMALNAIGPPHRDFVALGLALFGK